MNFKNLMKRRLGCHYLYKRKGTKATKNFSLVAGRELGGIGETVVNKGISQVVSKVLKGALASDNSLDEEAEHGEHGESAILDLLNLKLSECVGVVSKAQGVEGLTGVEGIETLTGGSTIYTVTLDQAHKDDLSDQGGSDGLSMDKGGVAEVVEAIITEDRGTSLEPDSGVTESDGAVAGKELGGHAAESAKHGPASVDDLDLAVLGEGLGVSGETSGIPAIVSGVLTLEVRHIRGEGAQELGAVSSVELGAGSNGAL